ncbi:hypothetical protein DFP74_6098 [Nocardiopsis sp. Huas11]|uniref:hypothetical protein n=1 Tax=Nocardiopsis sp. Huas11 TaxID=2183912 RepID=UPI000EB3DE7B|nr:hypothetical protein [Nocardiopsis sp. Huas11]RKS10335.1 hypothetical protein DFP74_6098 [Nocardiopsis sp. Huas11]
MSTSMPDTSPVGPGPPRDPAPHTPLRPSRLLCLTVGLACLAAIASGWGLTRLATNEPLTDPARSSVLTAPFSPTREGPENARETVETAADLVDAAASFHITFTLTDAGTVPVGAAAAMAGAVPVSPPAPTVAHGHATYDAAAEPAFEHYVDNADGEEVYRYELDGRYVVTARSELPGLLVPDPPSAADRYLCSRTFASARLREVLRSSPDLAFAGAERAHLAWPGREAGDAAYRYTGTFTAMRGDFDDGANTLDAVEGAEFQLWIGPRGYPRRFDYTSPSGHGERYEFHEFGAP